MTSYTHVVGVRTNWYKIRFYDTDTTTFSEYSDPTTSEELLRLCTVADVKRKIDTIGRWTDDEIFDIITDVDDLIYIDYGTPMKAVYSPTGKIDSTLQDTYYLGEENVHRVDRVFYGTTGNAYNATLHEYFLDDGYKTNLRYGMIRFLPVASGGPTLNLNYDVEVHYVPKIYNQLSTYRTVKRLLEQTDFTAGDIISKELDVVNQRLAQIDAIMAAKLGPVLSSDYEYYNPAYGINRVPMRQSHYRNRFIGSYGWD